MATEKIVNYTAAQTAELIDAYTAEPTKATVEAFATKFAKSAKSIIAKLATEGVYVSAAKTAATARSATKADLVAEIAKLAGSNAKDLESLEKATGPALKVVMGAMFVLAEQVVAARAEKLKGEEIST